MQKQLWRHRPGLDASSTVHQTVQINQATVQSKAIPGCVLHSVGRVETQRGTEQAEAVEAQADILTGTDILLLQPLSSPPGSYARGDRFFQMRFPHRSTRYRRLLKCQSSVIQTMVSATERQTSSCTRAPASWEFPMQTVKMCAQAPPGCPAVPRSLASVLRLRRFLPSTRLRLENRLLNGAATIWKVSGSKRPADGSAAPPVPAPLSADADPVRP